MPPLRTFGALLGVSMVPRPLAVQATANITVVVAATIDRTKFVT
jgi:hypothetical protein